MSAEASPRPWRVADYPQCPGLADVFDASGSPSGLVAGELKHADAALIVAAVNSYARKSPCRECEGYATRGGCIADERERLRSALSHVRNVLRGEPMTKAQAENQARFIDAALGEGETPTGKGVGR